MRKVGESIGMKSSIKVDPEDPASGNVMAELGSRLTLTQRIAAEG